MRPYGFVANSFVVVVVVLVAIAAAAVVAVVVVVISSSALSAYAFVQTENRANTVLCSFCFFLFVFSHPFLIPHTCVLYIFACTSFARSAQVFYSICSRGSFSLCLSSLWLLLLLLLLFLLLLMLHKIHIIYMCCHVCIVCLYYHEYFCQFNS